MNRVDRLMAYLLMFQSHGLMRAQDFASRFEISERTVYRDIQALCEVGVPIDPIILCPVLFSPIAPLSFTVQRYLL